MSISDKIGTHIIEIIGKAPNYEMMERMSAKRAPLSPNLFPFYAGTLEDNYGYYDENGFYIEGDYALEYDEGEVLAEDEMSDYDEVYKDELEAVNHPSFEDIEKISKLVDETEGDKDLQAKLDDLDKDHEDVHVAKFNDVQEAEEKKDVAPTISISEPVKEEVIEVKPEPTPVPPVPPMPAPVSATPAPTPAPVPPVPPVSITPKEVEENSNSYAAKFTTEAKAKSEYYSEVLYDEDSSDSKESN